MATDYKALGKRISNARKQAGITQEALGEHSCQKFPHPFFDGCKDIIEQWREYLLSRVLSRTDQRAEGSAAYR